MPFDEKTMERVRSNYERASAEIHEVLLGAMCTLYRDITGRKPSEELEEALRTAIRYND